MNFFLILKYFKELLQIVELCQFESSLTVTSAFYEIVKRKNVS